MRVFAQSTLLLCLGWPLFAATACSSALSPQLAVRLKAETQLHNALSLANTQRETYSILTRHNPCECDAEISYEVYIFGVWQRVQVQGRPELMEALKLRASSPTGVEVVAKMSSNTYLSSVTGQRFGILEVEQLPNMP